jgi:hypothetical protein
MNRRYPLLALCALSVMIIGCSRGPSGFMSVLEGQEAEKTDYYKTGYNALIRHKNIEAGYMAEWAVVNNQSISVQYKNNSDTPVAIKVDEFKMAKNNIYTMLTSSYHKINPNSQGIYQKQLNRWGQSENVKGKPPVYILQPKSDNYILIYFDNWDEKIAPKQGDIVTLDIPVGDKVFHIKSRLE